MGLFHRKKVEQPQRNLPEFPKFPEAVQPQQTPSAVPRYESPLASSERAQQTIQLPRMQQTQQGFDIPQRQPAFLRQDPLANQPSVQQPREIRVSQQSNESFEQRREPIWRPPVQPIVEEPQWQPQQQQREERLPKPEAANVAADKPVFVKIQEYREVMASIELLKQKIQDVEFILGKIEELRAQEKVELDNCQNNLNKMKEKLLAIDKKIFEV